MTTTMVFGKLGFVGVVMKFAKKLRFPWLFIFTACLFVLDLIIPDFIPLADELLLGLITLLFGLWRDQRKGSTSPKENEPLDHSETGHAETAHPHTGQLKAGEHEGKSNHPAE